ncbi:hypothetical protein EMWEY_00058560 [Eimeria maxima]|uniref:Uncharacterized protein n=1 Tax=Eimeria maxima TaxID=5804 RepID=U6MDD2_EIMMA|nr:hypothetical protein EMWEY_00058560 [Eimeria maxima]CDJ59675.1 hypothetical protein EMWEY_00058560 [Eimeria maxima]
MRPFLSCIDYGLPKLADCVWVVVRAGFVVEASPLGAMQFRCESVGFRQLQRKQSVKLWTRNAMEMRHCVSVRVRLECCNWVSFDVACFLQVLSELRIFAREVRGVQHWVGDAKLPLRLTRCISGMLVVGGLLAAKERVR